jgi:hypothetical protein
VRSRFCRWVLEKDNEEASKVLSLKPPSTFKIQFHDIKGKGLKGQDGSFFVKKCIIFQGFEV